ncbi:MAG: hypothetical protein ABI871_06625 [Chthoniobacterales bacterium]
MPGTVDDFMQRFSGNGTMDENTAAQYHDRFVSNHENDREFDSHTYHEAATQYLGKLPDDQFHDAARNAITQAPPQERAGLLGSLLGALGGAAGGGGAGGGLGQLAGMLGLGSTDPQRMSGDDAAKLMNYARREQPDALRQTVAEKPWFMKAMGNPIVMGALTMAAAKMLSSRRR